MLIFIVIGGIGLLLLLISLVFGELFDLLDGAVSGTGTGAALATFGAAGLVCIGAGWPEWLAYLLAAAIGLVILIAVQLLVRSLRRSEDGAPATPVGLYGTARSTITGVAGEVSLDGPHEIETRMAFSEERIEPGTRIRVVEQQGSRVKVVSAASAGTEGGA